MNRFPFPFLFWFLVSQKQSMDMVGVKEKRKTPWPETLLTHFQRQNNHNHFNHSLVVMHHIYFTDVTCSLEQLPCKSRCVTNGAVLSKKKNNYLKNETIVIMKYVKSQNCRIAYVILIQKHEEQNTSNQKNRP